uniref:protein strawberry notch homolog 1 isoform X2 n=1 Tax=Ciona intestinalis TaxID=7719 RepID=UPI0002B8D996|nr:protein strawberry notch homolog 1 isoform X2 [Ciona intestinalis]|eukprot:XP_002127283.2 protein strawberry notch homolog 1 isoform X2 [Ciona intestinalis]
MDKQKEDNSQDLLSAALSQSGLMNFESPVLNQPNTQLQSNTVNFKECELLTALKTEQNKAPIPPHNPPQVKMISSNSILTSSSASIVTLAPQNIVHHKTLPNTSGARTVTKINGPKIIKIPALKAGSIIKINKFGKADIIQRVKGNVVQNGLNTLNKESINTDGAKQVTIASSLPTTIIRNTALDSKPQLPKTIFLPAKDSAHSNVISTTRAGTPPISTLRNPQKTAIISSIPPSTVRLSRSASFNVPIQRTQQIISTQIPAVPQTNKSQSSCNLGSLFVETVEKSASFNAPHSPFSLVLPEPNTQTTSQSLSHFFTTNITSSDVSKSHSIYASPSLQRNIPPTVVPPTIHIPQPTPDTGQGTVRFYGKGLALRTLSMPALKPGEELAAEEEREEEAEMQHTHTYALYMPSKLNIGHPHPDSVVETSSLSSIMPPDIKYQLSIPQYTIDHCLLSALQLESVVYACQKHQMFLPNGERAGYFIGDGPGVGKGRTVAGVIYENYLLGRKRALWFSVSNDLKYDAERDLRDIGAKNIKVYSLNKFKYGKITAKNNGAAKKGVIFGTYSSLIGESHQQGKYGTRLKQILNWVGEDFDGVIIFDECHKAKNLVPSGSGKSTKTGHTVLQLQTHLPNARVVYASATGASEPKNMAYMSRLGLWGSGTPFPQFTDFIQAVERRGVGAMELVAMDMKLRGSYIARQLSFYGVSFRIEEVPLNNSFISMYNKAVKLWMLARAAFQAAASMIEAEYHMKKSMWAQFWSAHQRFFKYLCLSAKVDYTVSLVREAVKHGKCVVIGLQSTGESRTLDQLEKCNGELDDFVSTAKAVFETLIENHFPAPDRKRVTAVLGRDFYKKEEPAAVAAEKKAVKRKRVNGFSNSSKRHRGSNSSDAASSSESDDDLLSASDEDDLPTSSSDEDIHKIFGEPSDSEDWEKSERKRNKNEHKLKNKSKHNNNNGVKHEDGDHSSTNHVTKSTNEKKEDASVVLKSLDSVSGTLISSLPGMGPIEQAQALKSELLEKLETLGSCLPNNMLDELIDSLGGPENVAEMTGRKGRVIATDEGNVEYQTRAESDVPVELLNMTEKQRFMDGEKNIAIISEAASSGISLQADKRARNQRRRLHITLELPWSADRAIQQFGRTHRSNQVNAPEYVFVITELAGEHRFASVVAKRLESLGALTHGDRRATESRDFSKYNYDNKYGRKALELVLKSIAGYEMPIVPPPKNYKGNFFKDMEQALQGVGLIMHEPGQVHYQLDKDYNNIFKFMNRMLGMEVEHQNGLFLFFTQTLNAIVQDAKRSGQFDQGIVDLGAENQIVEVLKTKEFPIMCGGRVSLQSVQIERGISWVDALRIFEDGSIGSSSGFYVTLTQRNGKHMVILIIESTSQRHRGPATFVVYRPNTGKQVRKETLEDLKKKYKRVESDEAEVWWCKHHEASLDQCSHRFWQGSCSKGNSLCHIGKRRRMYHVLAGSVLAVWRTVEEVLLMEGGSKYKMQVVRLKTQEGNRIVGVLIPTICVTSLMAALNREAESIPISNNVVQNFPQQLNEFSSDDSDDYEDVEPDEMLSSVLAPKSNVVWQL